MPVLRLHDQGPGGWLELRRASRIGITVVLGQTRAHWTGFIMHPGFMNPKPLPQRHSSKSLIRETIQHRRERLTEKQLGEDKRQAGSHARWWPVDAQRSGVRTRQQPAVLHPGQAPAPIQDFRLAGFNPFRSLGRNRPSLRISSSSNQTSPPPHSLR